MVVYLPHNKSLSLCHCTGSSWPRAWSPPSGGWRGPGRPAARRWSWGAPDWWTSGWPGHRGINNTLLTSAGDLGVQDVSVSVQGNQHNAGAAEEHGGALDTAHSLAQPALQQGLDFRNLWQLIISPSKTSISIQFNFTFYIRKSSYKIFLKIAFNFKFTRYSINLTTGVDMEKPRIQIWNYGVDYHYHTN